MFPTQPLPQVYECAELELFHRSFTTPDLLRDFTNALLLGKTKLHDAPLIGRQSLDEVKKTCSLLRFFHPRLMRGLQRGNLRLGIEAFPPSAPVPVVQHVRGDTQQPGRKRQPTPFELRKICQSAMKNVRGNIFGFGPARNPPCHERVHAAEVSFVECVKAAGVPLCRLDKEPLVGFL